MHQTVVLRLTGELVAANAVEAVQAMLAASADMPRPSLLVFDLRDVALLAADGIRALRTVARIRAGRGVECCALVSPGTTVARVLDSAVPAGEPLRLTDLNDAVAQPDLLDPLLADFESLTRTLLTATTVGAALQQVVDAALLVVPDADLISVTLRAPDGRFYTPVDTGAVARELDQVQYETGQGPCLDAARPAGPAYTVSDDLRLEPRWPEFAAAAAGHGYRSIVSTELPPAARPGSLSGALNIYSRKPHGLTTADRDIALLLATHASLALAHCHTAELADLHQANLRQAIDSRDVIGQAKGILMTRQGITAEEAFDLLRRTSQHLNVKLVDVARTLTGRHNELDRPSA